MFNWFRKKKEENPKQPKMKKSGGDGGVFIPGGIATESNDKDKKHSYDDYSSGFDFGGSDGGGGGGD